LSGINEWYLRLAIAEGALPSKYIALISRNQRQSCALVRQLSFCLFELPFAMVGSSCTAADSLYRKSAMEGDQLLEVCPDRLAFVTSVFTYLWHLARIDKRTARVEFGVNLAECTEWERLSVTALPDLSLRMANSLALRWSQNRRFWELFVGACETGDAGAVNLLGRQLLAANLLDKNTRAAQ
jgi:hypothetical protein